MVVEFASEINNFFVYMCSLPLLSYSFLNNTVFSYIVALVIFIASMSVMRVFKYGVIRYLKILSKKTKNDMDDMFIDAMQRTFKPLLYVTVSLYVSLNSLSTSVIFQTYMNYFLMIVCTFYGIRFVAAFIDYGTGKYVERNDEVQDDNKINLIGNVAKAFLWMVAVLLILSNLGYDITTLVAGLGVGGVAVAFALQNILSDIFASFSIHFDKPFRVGDFIVIGEDSGTVKKIGIKSTRLKALEGEELVVSNVDLTGSRVHNYKKMKRRRIQFELGVDSSTSNKKLKKIPKMIEKIISNIDLLEFDRAHFKKFGDFSLIFEVVYYLKSKDYNVYMDKQQEINLKINEMFAKEKIKMPYPTQRIVMRK